MGNSLLLRFTEKANEVISLDDSSEPSSKRSKMDKSDEHEEKVSDFLTDFIASDVMGK